MIFPLPEYLGTAIALLVAIAMSVLLLRAGQGDLRRTALLSIAGLWVWLVAAQLLSWRGFFADPTIFAPGDLTEFIIFLALFPLPVIVLAALVLRVPSFKNLSLAIPLWILVGVQVYRIGGAAYLEAGIMGTMPAYLGYVTGIMDITIGATSIIVALGLAIGAAWARPAVIIWCIIGLLDFLNGAGFIVMAFFDIIPSTPDPAQMGRDPFLLISLFQAPLAISLHLLVLWRVWRTA